MIVDDLKKGILQICFNGGLSSTLETDTKVQKSIEKITKEKKELIKKYGVRNEPDYNAILEKEKLFIIPNTWTWLRIGQLGIFKKGPFGSALTKGMFIKKSANAIKVYEQKNAIQKDVNIGDYYITRDYFESKMKGFEVKTGDIIVSCAGTIGETFIIPENHEVGIINQALMRMTMVEELNISYFLLYFDFILKKISNNLSSGSAIKNIPPFEIFKQLVIPFPPIEEQQRIVDKIEELFAKLDEIKPIEEELKLIKNNFPSDMRKSILFNAISGKLSVQNNNDTPVDNQLEKIKREIEQFYLINKIKNSHRKDHDYKFFTDDKYVIPTTWKYVPLSSTCLSIFSGKSPKYVKYKNDNLILGQKVNQEDGLHFEDLKYGTDEFIKSLPKYQFLIKNDILLNTLGGGSVGRCGIFDNDTSNITTDGHIFVIRTAGFTNEKYIMYFLRLYREKLEDYANGTTNQKFFSVKQIEDVMIPLPPIEEQQRIVDKLEQLLPLCDAIDNLINK